MAKSEQITSDHAFIWSVQFGFLLKPVMENVTFGREMLDWKVCWMERALLNVSESIFLPVPQKCVMVDWLNSWNEILQPLVTAVRLESILKSLAVALHFLFQIDDWFATRIMVERITLDLEALQMRRICIRDMRRIASKVYEWLDEYREDSVVFSIFYKNLWLCVDGGIVRDLILILRKFDSCRV